MTKPNEDCENEGGRLFEQIARSDLSPRLFAEPAYRFLNRTARPAYANVRALMEDWFDVADQSSKRDLRARFCSDKDDQHLGAFFEMYCRALLRSQGFSVLTHQTADTSKSKVPDFKVSLAGRPSFYLESTLAVGPDMAAHARLNQLYDVLNKLESPNFFIGIELENAPTHPPAGKRMRVELEKRLNELDFDEMSNLAKTKGLEALPHWKIEDRGWVVVFVPIPKGPSTRGATGVRPLGFQFHSPQWVDSRIPLLNALTSKASRYGNLDLPYVIAVNELSVIDDDAIMDALFGKERYLVNPHDEDFEPVLDRAPDGAWRGPKGPRNTRVSAILLLSSLAPANVATRVPVLIHNPWASKPLDIGLWHGPQRKWDQNGELQEIVGKRAWEILGLPQDWPGPVTSSTV